MRRVVSPTSPKKKALTRSALFSLPPFAWQNLNSKFIIGLDEVGRGCLAGSVYAAAVIIEDPDELGGMIDSKMIDAETREEFAKVIRQRHRHAIGIASVEEIDQINIYHASLLAMKRAFENLKIPTARWSDCHLLIDGKARIRDLVCPDGVAVQQTCIIKGDVRALPIAAASIVAKVARDAEVTRLAKEYPGYGFEIHKGYGTPLHKSAIEKLGPCAIHRRTFSGVAEYYGQTATIVETSEHEADEGPSV